MGIAILALGIIVMVSMQFLGVRLPLLYVVPGVVMWSGAYLAGIHPAITGVIMGLMTPMIAGPDAFSPAEKLQRALHRWVAFGIMPLFALANAGVSLNQIRLDGDAKWLFWGVLLGLTLGKPIGIVAVSWLAARLAWIALPEGIGWKHISVIGMAGSIGFTMSLFIGQLAFSDPLLQTVRFAILLASGLGGVISVVSGRKVLKA
jgi:NhaA family Na+:H+ antiporter